jgi:glyoxylase-like metal-dependent hydrolase (beta-lactamase superfamily II)
MIIRLLCLALVAVLTAPAYAQEKTPSVTTTPIKDGLYLLKGRGGNVVASIGDDGVLLVDDDYAPYQPAYLDALKALGADGARFVVNTHWHTDHTESNAAWSESGSVIMAHDNVRRRLSTRQEMKMRDRVIEASPSAAWPLVTFGDSLAVHLNGETVEVQHFPRGHTDGDSMVFFVEPNVVHTGDHFFKDRFPFVDMDSGGTVGGFIGNIKALLDRVDGDTVIVPGHGSLATREDLERYYRMMLETRNEVRAMQKQGLDLEAIKARGLDPKWESWGSGFITQDYWITFLVLSPQ